LLDKADYRSTVNIEMKKFNSNCFSLFQLNLTIEILVGVYSLIEDQWHIDKENVFVVVYPDE
jgi:hypothetical protein